MPSKNGENLVADRHNPCIPATFGGSKATLSAVVEKAAERDDTAASYLTSWSLKSMRSRLA
jgi:hypothetical protein